MLSETLGMAKSGSPENAEFTLTGRFLRQRKVTKEKIPATETVRNLPP